MEINIFDVTHGFCAYIVADNGNVMLIDCGYNQGTGFRPSTYLRSRGCNGIEWFIVSNYDEDHLSDLPNLRANFPIQRLYRNTSISTDELRRLKLRGGSLGPGMRELLEMLGSSPQNTADPFEFPGIEMATFLNPYPTFDDTNNLSLVTFLHYRDIHIIFPGDLEKSGWEALLKDWSFRRHLDRVNIFVASHHGRESGYCPDVFEYCRHAEIAILSDGPIQYETQKVDYSGHVSGIPWGDGLRSVLTTRKDGMMTIRQGPNNLGWRVNTSH